MVDVHGTHGCLTLVVGAKNILRGVQVGGRGAGGGQGGKGGGGEEGGQEELKKGGGEGERERERERERYLCYLAQFIMAISSLQ